jgi:hypothetical protein
MPAANRVTVTSAVVFVPNEEFIAELIKEPEVVAARAACAQEALLGAQAVGESIRDTGAYLASLYVEGAELGSTDPGALAIEYGSVNNAPFAPLRRGADGTGAEVRDVDDPPPRPDEDDEATFSG